MAIWKIFRPAFRQVIPFNSFSGGIFKKIQIRQSSSTKTKIAANGPGLKEFLIAGKNLSLPCAEAIKDVKIPYLNQSDYDGQNRKVYFEVYGCQMNYNDTEVVWAILKNQGYQETKDIVDADVVLLITCAIREGAESKIWNRLKQLAALRRDQLRQKKSFKIGVLGCMAERLKVQLLEKEQSVDLVVGPDSYKDLPRLLAITKNGQSSINVLLSLDETYADIMPVRLNMDSVTAFVSIMRGCDNMCTYCIVPFTRGRERSRPKDSILNEVRKLADQGIKEITLLGQNVNSYRDISAETQLPANTALASGFKTVYKTKVGGIRFAQLLEDVARSVPQTRIRFTSPHPKDFGDDVLEVIANYSNICKSIHMPIQSGSSSVLERMRRGYTREAYLELVDNIRSKIPNIALSSDFICGFCGETDDEFADTLSLIEQVKFNMAYLFQYSMREKTTAFRRYEDNVPLEVKNKRLKAMTKVYRAGAAELNSNFIGQEQVILIEGLSKRSSNEVFGRNDSNIKCIIPICKIAAGKGDLNSASDAHLQLIKPGDFICTKITESNSQTLKGIPLYHTQL